MGVALLASIPNSFHTGSLLDFILYVEVSYNQFGYPIIEKEEI
jgi:hypothetical protein